ncbi:MAG: cupin domain-containing protein [Reichenbachiella sp.]|uniref:cupin domain-containing protein n=1 Tax=Reichenbachiella sp. TaxID=2184521 RepID=UPI003265DBA6
MIFHQLENLETKELLPGIVGHLIHTDTLTIGYFNIAKGAVLPAHAHVHEQVTNLLEGEFEMTVGGETKILTAGSVATIPSNAEHSGVALTDCKVIDVFNPVREDYK